MIWQRRLLMIGFAWACAWPLFGCQSKLPGPLVCEKMAFRALGRAPVDAEHSPLVKRLSERLTRGCLTVPFEFETIECVEQAQPLQRCAALLVRSHPERKAAVQQLLTELSQLNSVASSPF